MMKGNVEYLSIIVSMYLFCVLEGSGPLKSRLSLSKAEWPSRVLLEGAYRTLVYFLHIFGRSW